MKRIERPVPPERDGATGYMMHKDIEACDPMHPADSYEQVIKLWCPHCEILYDHEPHA